MSAPTVIVVIGGGGIVGAFESPDSLRTVADDLLVRAPKGSALRAIFDISSKELHVIADQADAAATHGETETGFRWKLCTVQ